MPVRSGVTVTDTSHLCRLNALMSLVCMQRATLKVITWSPVREQEVPLQQTLRLKVHPHRLDAIATVAWLLFCSFSFFLYRYLTEKFNVFLTFLRGVSKFICKICVWEKKKCATTRFKMSSGSFYLKTVTWWSCPVGNTWRVGSRAQLCAASAETMTFKYTFFPTL